MGEARSRLRASSLRRQSSAAATALTAWSAERTGAPNIATMASLIDRNRFYDRFGVWSPVIDRDKQFALRVKDLNAPTRAAFHGLRWYAPNPAYRVHARWIPYNPPKMLDIPTVLGTTTHLPAPGFAEFTLEGKVLRLEPVLEDPKSTELFFIMRDATSKTTTYGAGRFLYTELPDHGVNQPGEVWLDFNRLINPPCAFTAYATCPLPPSQNRLGVAIPAGEQRYHD